MEGKGRKPGSFKKLVCWLGIFFVILAVIVGITQIQKSCGGPDELKPFKPYLDEYINIPGLTTSTGEGQYIKGKVITVDIVENKLDDIYLELPADMAATTPEEVTTIIWLKWENVYVGRYWGGSAAYKITCEVTLIDKEKAVIVGKNFFEGSDPPQTVAGEGDGYGSKPTEEIIDYLKSLPRQ